MEREYDSDRYDGEIYAKAKPGEKGSLVGEVGAGGRGDIREDERGQEREMSERITIWVSGTSRIVVSTVAVSEVEREEKSARGTNGSEGEVRWIGSIPKGERRKEKTELMALILLHTGFFFAESDNSQSSIKRINRTFHPKQLECAGMLRLPRARLRQ